MFWSTNSRPVPLEDLGWINTSYLASSKPHSDPYLIWGTNADMENMEPFLAEMRKTTGTFISAAHVLVSAVAASLRDHPKVSRRVIGRRVYDYRDINIVMPMLETSSGEVDSIFVRSADKLSLAEIAGRFWEEARQRALKKVRRQNESPSSRHARWNRLKRALHLRWVHTMSSVGFFFANRFRLPVMWKWEQELHAAGAFVNYLGSPGTPPLISHKLASLGMNSYSVAVTLGPTEQRPVVIDGAIGVRKEASLFVRVDHRFVNGHLAGNFVNTVRSYLMNPTTLLPSHDASSPVSAHRAA